MPKDNDSRKTANRGTQNKGIENNKTNSQDKASKKDTNQKNRDLESIKKDFETYALIKRIYTKLLRPSNDQAKNSIHVFFNNQVKEIEDKKTELKDSAKVSFDNKVVDVNMYKNKDLIFYKSGAKVDADGSPHAYNEDDNKGRDNKANGQNAFVTEKNGDRVTDGEGYILSGTAYVYTYKGQKDTDWERYVDAEKVPYIVYGDKTKNLGAKLGDICFLFNKNNFRSTLAFIADLKPSEGINEISIKAAENLGLNPSPKYGGISDPDLYYFIFTNSKRSKHYSDNEEALLDINLTGRYLLSGGKVDQKRPLVNTVKKILDFIK